MIYSPIWKDNILETTSTTLNYRIRDLEAVRFIEAGYTKAMPGQTGATLCINNKVDERLKPDFDYNVNISGITSQVIPNTWAVKTYRVLDSSENDIGTYKFLYDWSYEDNWTGQTGYYMSESVNTHIDPRMKLMRTIYNTAQTSYSWTIEYDVFVRFAPNSLFFIYSGESKSITVYTNGSWQITSMPDWLSASTTTGNEGSYSSISETLVTFTASANPRGEDRSGNIVFTADGKTYSVPVKQNSVHIFDVTPLSYSCAFTGGTCNLTITANDVWYVYGNPSWVTVSQASGTASTSVDVVVGYNASYNSRSCVLYFRSKNKIIEVGIAQGAFEDQIEIVPSSYSFSYTGGYAGFKVYANKNWHIVSLPDWLTLESASAGTSGNSGFAVSCEGNSQYQDYTGSIVVVTDTTHSATASTSVVLEAKPEPYISITPTTVQYADTGETKQYTIVSNYDWTLVSYPEWISVDKNGGIKGTSILSTTGSTNDTFNNITGTIRVETEDGYYATTSLTLKRKKYTLSVSPGSIDAPISGGTFSLSIDTNYNWRSNSDYTLSQSSGGSGTTVVTFTLGENTGLTSYRYIRIYNDDNYISIRVRQQGTQENGPITFYITEPGNIEIHKNSRDQNRTYVQYSLNAEPYVDIVKNENDATLSVSAGDIVQFKKAGSGSGTIANFSGSTCGFDVAGYASSLGGGSYYYFLANCTGLTSASDLIIGGDRLDNAFDGCINMEEAPSITFTQYAHYNYTFRNCRKLKETMNLYNSGFAIDEASGMYSGCTSLVKINASLLKPSATPTGNTGCLESMFEGCTALTEAPDIVINGKLDEYDYGSPASLTGGTISTCKKMFKDCKSLINAPKITRTGGYPYIPYSAGESMCESMFEGCTSLTTVQDSLPSGLIKQYAYKNMFKGCTSLATAPKLNIHNGCSLECFYGMFDGCTSLTTPPELETPVLAEGCYENMFRGCTSLVEAPILPARYLEPRCYQNMFSGCTNLNSIECYAVDENTDSLTNWVSGVANAGEFIYYEEKTDWTRSNSGIPSNWSVKKTDNPQAYPLTFKFLADGTVGLKNKSGETITTDSIMCRLNGGTWGPVSSITVTAGDVMQIKRISDTHKNNGVMPYGSVTRQYDNLFLDRYYYFSSTARFVAEGNIMSVSAPWDYYYNYDLWIYTSSNKHPAMSDYTRTYTYGVLPRLFYHCTNLVDASRLVIPSKSITPFSYNEMFRGCVFDTAPALGFDNIFDIQQGYATDVLYKYPGCVSMFAGCSNLKYVKCLIEGNYTLTKWYTDPYYGKVLPFLGWLSGVAQNGTFIKSTNSQWESDGNGIPSGWTVVNV